MNILGAIVAGGRSRRMGQDKLMLELRGKRLIDHVAERIAPQVNQLIINTNEDFERFQGHIIVPDLRQTGSPLAGIHAALVHAEAHGFTHVLTVSGDTPFLPADLVARLCAAGSPAIAESQGQLHYLIGLWPVSLLPDLTENIIRVQDWAAKAKAAHVHWNGDPFANINTAEDLAAARQRD